MSEKKESARFVARAVKSKPERTVNAAKDGKSKRVECEKCMSEFDEASVSDGSFVCRVCKMEERVMQQEIERRRTDEKLDSIEKAVKKIAERIDALENKSVNEIGKKDETELKTVSEESKGLFASELLAHRLECDDNLVKLGEKVGVIEDRVTAFEMQSEEFKREWPTTEEWTEIKRKKPMQKVAKQSEKICFAEKCKSREKDTVVLLGDSLVREVGRKLEADSHMFTAISKGGARIENMEEEISRLEKNRDRHLVVMIGTNNVQNGRSEVMLNAYEKLIEHCKSVGNRAVTMVGIPSRYDLNSVDNSRRIGINEGLKLKCEASGVGYLEYECGRSRLARDGLHLNNLGQDELARKIFAHCKGFLG